MYSITQSASPPSLRKSRLRQSSAPSAFVLPIIVFVLGRIFIPNAFLDTFMNYSTEGGSFLAKFHPMAIAVGLLTPIVLFAAPFSRLKADLRLFRGCLILLGVSVYVMALGVLTHRTAGLAFMLDSIFIAPITVLVLLTLSEADRRQIASLLLACLVVNDLVLFFEFATHIRIMPYPYHEPIFRPTAFLNHPLMNGQINGAAIPFALLMPWPKRTRYAVALIFVAATFAAGARLATLLSVVTVVVCFVMVNWRSIADHRKTFGDIIVPLTFLFVAIGAFVAVGFTARFQEYGLLDKSANSRFVAFSMFDYLMRSDLILGLSQEKFQVLMHSELGLVAIENWLLVFLVKFGIVGSIALIPGILYYLYTLARYRRSKLTIIGVAVFLILVSATNGFSDKGPLLVYISALAVCAVQIPRAKQARWPVRFE